MIEEFDATLEFGGGIRRGDIEELATTLSVFTGMSVGEQVEEIEYAHRYEQTYRIEYQQMKRCDLEEIEATLRKAEIRYVIDIDGRGYVESTRIGFDNGVRIEVPTPYGSSMVNLDEVRKARREDTIDEYLSRYDTVSESPKPIRILESARERMAKSS